MMARPLARTNLETARTAPGSIIAAIIGIQAPMKNVSEPRSVAAPMSISCIRRALTTQDAAAMPSVPVTTVK